MPRVARLGAAFCALPACVWAQPRPTHDLRPPAVAPTRCEVTDDAAVARLTEDITWIASDALAGRAPGTPGGDGAAEYLARSLRRIGLAEAGTDGYRQPFVTEYGLEAADETALTLTHDGVTHALTPGPSLRLARGTIAGDARGELVYAHSGCVTTSPPWDDLGPGASALRNAIVVLREGPPALTDAGVREGLRAQCSLARRLRDVRAAGARAVVVIAPEDEVRAPDYIPQESTGIPVVQVSAAEGRWLVGGDGGDAPAAPVVRGQATLRVALRPHRVTTANLVAVARGTARDHHPDVLVVGAHYDHLGRGGATSRSPEVIEIHNGADDNGSGTVALLEIARQVQARPLTRDVVFVWFGAEELGLVGSEFFVSHRLPAAANVRAMMNLDMVGRLRSCRLFVEGRSTSDDLWPVVDGANAGFGFDARPWEASRGPWGSSDHEMFVRARVPVLFLFTGLHDEYHRPEDDVATLNLRGLGAVAGFGEALLRRLDAGPAPVFQR